MCVTFIYVSSDPAPGGYRLILISNRDEHHNRPALPLHVWEKDDRIMAGMDRTPGKEDGTWLGASKTGRVAILLNLNGYPISPNLRGRGSLVPEYLLDKRSSEEFLKELSSKRKEYNPFHLVTLDLKEEATIWHLSSGTGEISHFENGCYAFDNSSPGKPYQKSLAGQKKLSRVVEKYKTAGEPIIESLMEILKDDTQHWPDSQLEKTSEVRNEWKPYISAINVKIPGSAYGSRTHSAIVVDYEWNVDFAESTLVEDGTWKNTTFTFNIND